MRENDTWKNEKTTLSNTLPSMVHYTVFTDSQHSYTHDWHEIVMLVVLIVIIRARHTHIVCLLFDDWIYSMRTNALFLILLTRAF